MPNGGKTSESTVAASEKEGIEGNNNAVESASKSNQTLVEIVPTIDILQANLLENNKLNVPLNIIKPNADKKPRWRLSAFGTTALDWVRTSYVLDRIQHFQEQRVANVGVKPVSTSTRPF